MRFSMLLAAGLAFASPLTLQADTLDQILQNDRPAFEAAVRDYLLTNPEVLLEAMEVLQERETAEATTREQASLAENKAAIYENPNDWAGGNLEGDITVVEFMDYRCGYCHKAYNEVNELVKTDGNIRFVLKEFPVLGEQSTLAAQFAVATKMLHGDEKYKAVHDALFSMRADISEASLSRIASDLGLDGAAILAKGKGPEVAAVLAENYRLAQAMEINGTPTFIINETMVRGYVPLNDMRDIVKDVRENG